MRIGDPLTDNGGLSGNGTYYILRLNAPLETFLAEGTYTMQPGSDKYTEYTIPTDELSYVSHHGRTNYIKKGTMTVAYANELCDIEITLTATDNTTYHTTYKGNYPVIDKSIKWLAESKETKMTHVISTYLDDSKSDNSNLNITLYENLDENGWVVVPSNVLILVGNAKFDSNGELLPGTYPIDGDPESEDKFFPGACVNFLNAPFPTGTHLSYYYDAEHPNVPQIGLVSSGTVTVERNEKIYTLTYDLTTDKGRKVAGSYTGPLTVKNAPKEEIKHDWDLQEDHVLKFGAEHLKAQAFSDKYTVDGALVWQIQLQQYDQNWSYTSDQITIRTVCALENNEEPVPGTYRVSAGNEIGTVMAGEYFGTFGTGTCFQHYEEGAIASAAAAVDGEMKLTKNEDGTYTIEFDFIDPQPQPKHFSGSWTGTLEF